MLFPWYKGKHHDFSEVQGRLDLDRCWLPDETAKLLLKLFSMGTPMITYISWMSWPNSQWDSKHLNHLVNPLYNKPATLFLNSSSLFHNTTLGEKKKNVLTFHWTIKGYVIHDACEHLPGQSLDREWWRMGQICCLCGRGLLHRGQWIKCAKIVSWPLIDFLAGVQLFAALLGIWRIHFIQRCPRLTHRTVQELYNRTSWMMPLNAVC